MQASGLLEVIVRDIVRIGKRLGGGPGVAVSGGIAAGCIGAFTGFTQPAIMAVVSGAASVKLGVDPSKAAAVHGHAGHLGNFGGFTHPTQVAILATIGSGVGLFNVYGALIALSVFAASFIRLKVEEKRNGKELTKEEMNNLLAEFEKSHYAASSFVAFLPFIVLVTGFVMGFPIFFVGVTASVVVMILMKMNPKTAETDMLLGVGKIATPLVATIGFLFLSAVIRNIGLVKIVSDAINPILSIAPIQIMLLVSALTALMTQSYGASAAIIIPFLQVVLKTGVDPMAAGIAAGAGGALMQYFLTGGPVAALPTVIPVIPNSDLKTANRFQRPSILAGLLFALILATVIGL